MQKKVVGTILIALCLALLAAALPLAAQTKDAFQTGKVVQVKKLNGNGVNPSGNTDASYSADVYRYTVSVRVADEVYDLQVDSPVPNLKELINKDQPIDIIIGGRTARVRNLFGEVTTFPITGRHPA